MKAAVRLAVGIVLLGVSDLYAATLYVSPESPYPAPPYATWETAATNIQHAVDTALTGDVVVVSNGVYAGGLEVNKSLTLQSVHGPRWTMIDGSLASFGDPCVVITNGVSLSGFTMTNGNYPAYGGGVWCATTNAYLTNCVIAGNRALQAGGGAYGATLYNCMLTGNGATNGSGGAFLSTLIGCVVSNNITGGVRSCTLLNSLVIDNTRYGGGAEDCRLYNCTLTGNSYGAAISTLYNCVVYHNPRSGGANYDPATFSPFSMASAASTFNYCCTTPLPRNGTGNITNEPAFAGRWRLSASSPCRGAGNAAYARSVDLEGEPWVNPPSIGCDEFYSHSCTGALAVAITASWTNVATGFAVDLEGAIAGKAIASRWEFGDGTVESNRLHTTHPWRSAGDYEVVLRAHNIDYPAGVTASMAIHVVTLPVHYVSLRSSTPVAPYRSWDTAATNIQEAVNAAAIPGALVLVTNGIYPVGGSPISVGLPVTLQSVNGPGATAIQGSQVPAVRCVTLNDNAVLSGFTLTNGFAHNGGGVYCSSTNAVITNCVIAGNSAADGGGSYSGTLNDCVLSDNHSAWAGGGAYGAILNRCTLAGNSSGLNGGGGHASTLNNCTLIGNTGQNGGGSDWSRLNRCIVMGNSAQNTGGGAHGGTLNNCLVISNSSGFGGAGAQNSALNNCTLVGNMAPVSTYSYAGGAFGGTANNSILYDNSPPNHFGGILNYCCTTPFPAGGIGNFTNAPLLVSPAEGNFRLQAGSPCINAGNNTAVTGADDLGGNPRVVSGTIDIGAYESPQAGSVISYAWLQRYGLPTDSSADFLDSDNDGLNNWQEWICGAAPTNSLSRLRLLSATPAGTGVTLIWQSASGIRYFLERSADVRAWSSPGSGEVDLLATDIEGQPDTTSYTDNHADGGPFFYRVGVKAR